MICFNYSKGQENQLITITAGWEVPDGFVNVGLAYDTKEDILLIGEYRPNLNGQIHKVKKDGMLIATIESPNSPNFQGVAYDSANDTIWVTIGDEVQNNVKQLDKQGHLISQFSISGKLGAGIAYNWDNDTLYISPYIPKNTIYEVSKNGAILKTINIDSSFGDSKYGYYADGIAYDKDGSLWITQNGKTSIFQIDQEGKILKSLNNPAVNEAEGIAIDPLDDTIWYSADDEFHQKIPHGNRIYHIDKNGNIINDLDD